jgi:hypothetical protein
MKTKNLFLAFASLLMIFAISFSSCTKNGISGGDALQVEPLKPNTEQIFCSFVEKERESDVAVDLPMALFSILTRVDADPLLAFASGWAALDSLVKEAASIICPEDVLSKEQWDNKILDLIKESQCLPLKKAKRSTFLKRFAAVAHFLFEMDREEDVSATIRECWDEYQKRNFLYHEGDNVSSPPSIDFLSRTLAKFLYACLDSKQKKK